MNEAQRKIIQKNYVALVRDLECSEDFVSYFVPQKVMTETMIEELMVSNLRHLVVSYTHS